MTSSWFSYTALCIALCGVAMPVAANAGSGAENRKITQLERQLAVLRESYALARSDADTARAQLRDIRERLDALGGTALGQSEERLVEMASQLETARAELETLRQSSFQLAAAINTFTKGALAEDAQARQVLEAALRDLDVALGLRSAPKNEFEGSLHNAIVLSIDSESGLIVINAGREAKVEVGMPMEIIRGDQVIADAIVTDTRRKVSGLLVQKLHNTVLPVKVGDTVSVKSSD